MTKYRICLLPGDGVGPEVSEATLQVLNALADYLDSKLDIRFIEGGDNYAQRYGQPLPEEAILAIRDSDACLKGPVGATAMDVTVRLRQMFDLYANVRPIKSYSNVQSLSDNVDFVIVRENTEDLYKGFEFELDDTTVALRVITKKSCLRIAEYAFRLARERNNKKSVVAVHKANVMRKTCGTFLAACREVARSHEEINFSDMLVDTAAMNLIRRPDSFDVIVTTNVFGDILSDEAAQIVGGLGMAPSANIGENFALFEPVHGSAPDIAGLGVANPLSMILSAKMMLEWIGSTRNDDKFRKAAAFLQRAVERTLLQGVKTPDIGGTSKTTDVASAVRESLSLGVRSLA